MKKKNWIVWSLLLVAGMASSMAQQRVTRNDFKVTLLSLGSGSSRFTYERAFSPRHSAELTVGIIGWGWDIMNKTEQSDGLLMKAAYKWNLIPQRNADSWLAGFYVKPEWVIADFDYIAAQSDRLEHTFQMTLLAECGYQWVKDWFDFDVYCGLGPSWGSGNSNNYFHSFMLYPRDSWLAFTAGFRIGIAF